MRYIIVCLLILLCLYVILLWIFPFGKCQDRTDDPCKCSLDLQVIQTVLTSPGGKSKEALMKLCNRGWISLQNLGYKSRYVIDDVEAPKLLNELFTLQPKLSPLGQLYNESSGVMKSDIMRIVALYLRGGLYCDYSKIVKRFPVDDGMVYLFTEHESAETELHSIRQRAYRKSCIDNLYESRIRILSAVIAATGPFQSFFLNVLKEQCKRYECVGSKVSSPYDILFLTGPDTLSTVYNSMKRPSIKLFTVEEYKKLVEWISELRTNWRSEIK